MLPEEPDCTLKDASNDSTGFEFDLSDSIRSDIQFPGDQLFSNPKCNGLPCLYNDRKTHNTRVFKNSSKRSTNQNGREKSGLLMPEPSARRASFNLNDSASEFVPSIYKAICPSYAHASQDYIAESDSCPTSPLPERTPASKAAGPGKAQNIHIKKLNKEVKRLERRRRKSGMLGLVEDQEGVAASDDVRGKSSLLISQSL